MSLSGTTPAKPLIVDNDFTTMPVDDKVLVYREFTKKKQTLQTIRERFPTRFFPNTDSCRLLFGPAYAQPQAWAYLPLVNPTNRTRKMILDLEHNHCDTLEVFLLRGPGRQVMHLGKLFRGTPLVRRAVPVRTFALPFELAPHDSAGLLLYSRRTTGTHELSITLSAEPYFTLKYNQEQTRRLFTISGAFFCVVAAWSVGLIFRNRLLTCLGLYAFAITLRLLGSNHFFDGIPFPSWLGLNADSVELFIVFLTNRTYANWIVGRTS